MKMAGHDVDAEIEGPPPRLRILGIRDKQNSLGRDIPEKTEETVDFGP